MRRISLVIFIFFLLFACNSTVPPPDKNSPHQGVSNGEPFDRHGQLILTKHARCRMDCRHITTVEIQEILDEGEINYSKSEPDAEPDPKFAVEGYTAEKQHLRIIVAPEGGKLIVITCIELGVEWTCHCN